MKKILKLVFGIYLVKKYGNNNLINWGDGEYWGSKWIVI